MRRFFRRNLRAFLRFYPPLWAAGIRVLRISPDFREIDVELRLHFWNSNYVGTHYGGSLYSMTDPFYMLMLIHNLGPAYIVWDKAARIRFRKPGRGRVTAQFRLSEAQIDEIRHRLESEETFEPVYPINVLNESGEVVAEVEKTLYVRKK